VAGASTGGGGTTADLHFDTDIWPIFSANCGPCHTTGNSGGQSIGSSDKAKALSDAKANQTDIIADIANGTMPLGTCMGPPDSDGCLTNADFQKIEAWFKAGAPE
jgi:mono/diheme cytochrome c family protein